MNVTHDVTATLRAQMGGHPPVICLQANMIDRDAKMNGCGWNEEGVSYTVNTIDRNAVCYAVDSHPTDSRIEILGGGIMPTVTAHIHKGSADGPLVLIENEDIRNREPSGRFTGED